MAKKHPIDKPKKSGTDKCKSLSQCPKSLLDELNNLPDLSVEKDPVKILRSLRKTRRIKAMSEYYKERHRKLLKSISDNMIWALPPDLPDPVDLIREDRDR